MNAADRSLLTMRYRLDELEALASEMGLSTIGVDASRLDVLLWEGCRLAFCNLEDEEDTLVGFDGTPWHSHGHMQFATGKGTYVELDELELLIGIATGELVVVSQYLDGSLRDRWLVHKNEPFGELPSMEAGEELRVARLAMDDRPSGP